MAPSGSPACRIASVKALLKLTMEEWARNAGIHETTLGRGMAKAGIEVKPKKLYTFLEASRGYTGGDLKTEQTRKTRAEADAKELENRVRLGELIETASAKAIYGEIATACRTFIAVELGQVGAEANPTNPDHGREVAVARGRQFLERLSNMEKNKQPVAEAPRE